MMPLHLAPSALATPALRAIAAKLREILPAGQGEIDKFYQDMAADAALATEAALQRFLAEYAAQHDAILARLNEAASVREVRALFALLMSEASRSVTLERVQMLCAALAGSLTPDLDAEMKSRVARALTELEPSDVLLLRRFTADESNRIHVYFQTPGPSALALERTGCLYLHPPPTIGLRGVPRREVTALGIALVSFVSLWTPAEQPASD